MSEAAYPFPWAAGGMKLNCFISHAVLIKMGAT